MEHADLLRYVVDVLDRLHLRYFVTGSTASIFFGEPRFTNDIDVVVDLPMALISDFCIGFPGQDFYVSEVAVRQAVILHSQFNIIHPDSGLKVDVMVPTDTAFNRSRFERIRRVVPGDYTASFASPEDVIIKKMEYFREGGSEKHLRDIASMLRLCPDPVDRDYIQKWATELDLLDVWKAILDRIG